MSYKDIGERLGLSPELISQCKWRFESLVHDCEWEQLFDVRGAPRNDALSDDWREHALSFWTDQELLDSACQPYGFVRYSERAKDQIRDPANRTSKETFRIGWLEARVGDVYEAMKAAGKAKWSSFHMSQTVFSELRPFYIKAATRETCLCIYHMRWAELCSGCTTYRHKLREQKLSRCNCPVPKNADEWRKRLICSRAASIASAAGAGTVDMAVSGGATVHSDALEQGSPLSSSYDKMFSYDNLSCMVQACDICKDLQLLTSSSGAAVCAAERHDPGEGVDSLLVCSLCNLCAHSPRPIAANSSPRTRGSPVVFPLFSYPLAALPRSGSRITKQSHTSAKTEPRKRRRILSQSPYHTVSGRSRCASSGPNSSRTITTPSGTTTILPACAPCFVWAWCA